MFNIIKNWNCISVHIWLIMSSFGIIFALLSFMEDLGYLSDLKMKYNWIKGILSLLIGCLFYLIIGLPHLNGAQNR